MNIRTYLERIGYDQPVQPDAKTLIGLHRAHLLTVPFENLDIHLAKPIRLTESALWEKIIVHRRGGFCYELNGMFAWLLKEIGFEVTYLNGRVYNSEEMRGRDFDHLTLLVEIPNENVPWLADIGFGDSFVEPLRVEFNSQQAQGLRAFRLEKVEDGIDLWRRDIDGSWERQYFFDLKPRNFPSDYEGSCLYHQTSPKSSFTREKVISRATPKGRVSLDGKNLTITTNGKRTKQPVDSDDEYRELLRACFGVTVIQSAGR
jgi:N-hydroxyarylamine O-acetyltransferase